MEITMINKNIDQIAVLARILAEHSADEDLKNIKNDARGIRDLAQEVIDVIDIIQREGDKND